MILAWPPTPIQKMIAAGIGIFIAIIVLWLWVSANERRARDLAIAEERERAAQVLADENAKREKERQVEREQTAKLIEANIQLAQKLQQTVVASNVRASRERQEVLAPKSLEDAIKDAIDKLGITPRAEPDNRVSITKEELQGFSAMKVEVERLTRNDESQEKQIRLLEDTNARLIEENKGYKASLAEKDELLMAKEEVIKAYAKVAKKSRFRTVVETTGKVGLGILAGYIGAKAGSN